MNWFFILAMAISGYFLFESIYSLWNEKINDKSISHEETAQDNKVVNKEQALNNSKEDFVPIVGSIMVDSVTQKFETALNHDLDILSEKHLVVAIDRSNLGEELSSHGEYKKAIPYLELALATYIEKLGKSHPSTAVIQSNLTEAKEKLVKPATQLTEWKNG